MYTYHSAAIILGCLPFQDVDLLLQNKTIVKYGGDHQLRSNSRSSLNLWKPNIHYQQM
jgi:hypothetical protein